MKVLSDDQIRVLQKDQEYMKLAEYFFAAFAILSTGKRKTVLNQYDNILTKKTRNKINKL